MATFSELPLEILALIAEKLFQKPEPLIAANLLLCKRWYTAVLPVFLLEVKTDIHLSSADLERLPLPPRESHLRLLQRTQRLSLRLIGRASRQRSRFWYGQGLIDYVARPVPKAFYQSEEWSKHTSTPPSSPRLEGDSLAHQRVLAPWRTRMNERISALTEILPTLSSLTELRLEALSQQKPHASPRPPKSHHWFDYLYAETVERFVLSCPLTVVNLTLDLSGTECIPEDSASPHLCCILAQRLGDFENVRLRLHRICPLIFGLSTGVDTYSEYKDDDEYLRDTADSISKPLNLPSSRLANLNLKLSIPLWHTSYADSLLDEEARDEQANHTTDEYEASSMDDYDAKRCPEYERTLPLYKQVIIAGCAYATESPKLKALTVSYRHPSGDESPPGINLVGYECTSRQRFYDLSEVFCYEDDGNEWDGWEECYQDHDRPAISRRPTAFRDI